MDPVDTPPNDFRTHGHGSLVGCIALPVSVVLVIYIWYISAGLWATWPKTAVFDYYNSLAEAFQAGQVFLLEQPPSDLLALPDPYRIGARKDVEHIWDASLYHGRYYLYWGPVPALVLLPVRLLPGFQTVPDMYLAFGFIAGLFLVLSRLLLRVWTRFFSELPLWTLSLGIFVSGLAPPIAWMLNRPEVYEAALVAGQFFLLWGLYLCYSAVDGAPRPTTRLALASASLGLAIGCRTSEALPAAFIVLVTTLFIWREHRARASPTTALPKFLALCVPFVAVVLGLLWYNWARFGSVLEFGYRYQLTLLQMPKHYDELFSTAYLLPNLYNYFLNPFTIAPGFPLIRPQYGMAELGPAIDVPRIYFSEAITGLVYTFPFMVFAAGLLRPPRKKAGGIQEEGDRRAQQPLNWLRTALIGVITLEFVALLLFFFATQRYLVEAVPSLALAACIGWWLISLRARSVSGRSRWIFLVAILLASASVTSSLLLAVSSYQERIRVFNPEFITAINRLLQH